MKPFKGSVIHAARDYWTRLMQSVKNNKISRGAANFARAFSTPFKDNWRRKDTKNHHK